MRTTTSGKTSSNMGVKDELVLANDPNEEEEEVELVDPQETLKESCQEKAECQKLKEELERCNERVESRPGTEETCTQELFDFLHCVDHCVAHSVFNHLK